MKKYATTIFLVVFAAALSVWFWLDRDKVTEGERKRRDNNVFVAWRKDELSRIEILVRGEAAGGGETIVLARDAANDSAWRMLAPQDAKADQAAVERLLATLEFATVLRKASESSALGLEQPRASGSVTMGGLAFSFALGGPSPRPEDSSYFRVGSDGPIVVSKELTAALLRTSDTYRDRTVVPYLSLELARFEVARPGGGFALERIDEHSFRVASEGVLASRDALEKVWGALAEMRAESFPKDADADRLTANPALTITMTPQDKSRPPAELVVGEACPGNPDDVVVLRKTPTRVAACAPRIVLDALHSTPASLVEDRPFFLRADEIEELRLEWLTAPDGGANPNASNDAADAGASAPKAIEIARKGTGFRAREPFDRDLDPAEADAASELVGRIASSEAEHVARGPVRGAAGGPFVPVARARIRFDELEQSVEIGPFEVGPDGRAKPVILRRVFDDARLEVPAAVARRFVPRVTSLRPRSLLEGTHLEGTRRVTHVVLRCGVDQEFESRAGEGLRYVEPKGYEADGSLTDLVSALTRGKVDAWVADAPDPSFGLTGDACRVVLGFEDGKAPQTVVLGAEGEGGIYGRLESSPEVFVAPTSLRELASRIYVSRAALRVPAERIERVTVTYEGKPVPPQAGGDAAVRDAVSALFADRVVAIGPKAKAMLGSPSLVIEVAEAENGPRKRVGCTVGVAPAVPAGDWLCGVDSSASGASATFAVARAKLAPLLPALPKVAAPEGGADASSPGSSGDVARDGGPR